MRGSCLCGEVVFEVAVVAGPFELCHCRRCRKASGSAYTACLGVRTAGYRIVRGRDLVRTYEAAVVESPPPYRVWFCSRCGSPLPDPDPGGDWFEIPAGLIDDSCAEAPDKHIYVDLRADWDRGERPLPAFTTSEIRAFRARHGRVRARASGEPDP